jgi:acyl-CoA-binding protein
MACFEFLSFNSSEVPNLLLAGLALSDGILRILFSVLQSEGAGEDVTKESEEGNVTDDWEGVESTELEELFGAASTYVTSLVTLPGVKPSSDAMLQLYAYYKIATEGPCSTTQPSAFQPTARAKWYATLSVQLLKWVLPNM